MKKLISLFLTALIMLFTFCGCSSSEKETYPLTVNGTTIDSEIFSFYLDSVWNDPSSLGTRDGRITQATYMCIRYVAVNSTFVKYGLSLDDGEKAKISEEANVLWNMFGAHYSKIGVSKQTFLKIRTSEFYTEKLRLAFFDKGGTDEISDDILRGVLMENFIAFRYIRTPALNQDVYGHDIEYTAEETAKINTLYNNALTKVTASYGTESAYTEISKAFPLTEQTYETLVTDSNDTEFTTVFFNTVKAMEQGTAKLVQYGGFIYLIYRINILSEPQIFSEKRSECLKIISEEPLQSKINTMCNSYQSVRNSALAGRLYEEVANNK